MKKIRIDDTKQMIVGLLAKNKQLRYSEIKKELGITDRAVSNNLTFLINEKTIEFEKKGREKYYSLSKTAFYTWERKIGIFSSNYTSYLEKKWSWPRGEEAYQTPTQAYEDINKKIGIFYLYTMLKSLETGKNWIDAVDTKRMFEDLAKVILDFIFVDQRTKQELFSEDMLMTLATEGWEKFFAETKKMIRANKNNEKLDLMFKELENQYPEEFGAIKQSEKEKIMSLFDFEDKNNKK
ncbi:winged helix-turn-helix domain-containing protein [Nitrosopumilus piranensis]|uniref:HTH arsR-type domain-containing protein n=1 Tax=Nitrosopumilus piranensis TaxID=1582439 RepID=A0A0C5BR02_9ARCH|nr:winged helix-turn-helix domain-containing protein [Nitrosopumilus piranensis]AJM92188.1 hypothetical protein NPIRD3C_0976 [Nitrosopumilus piranensis]